VVFGVTFFPLAALKLFKIPANELTHQRIDINALLGNLGTELSEKVYKAKTFHQKARVVTEFFNFRLKELHLKYQAMEELILPIGRTNFNSIRDLVAQSFLSQRQFER